MTRPSPTAPLWFIVKTVACQGVAFAAAVITWRIGEHFLGSLFTASVAAWLFGTMLEMSKPWRILNVVLPLAVTLSFSTALPNWVFLAPLLVLAAIYAPALWTRVPYYPTSNAAYPLILAELPPDKPFTFVDIGCGFGDLIFFLRKHRPNGTFVGVEIGILPYLVAYGKTVVRRDSRVTILYQDMWKLSLKDFDFVYAFLSPAAMTRVWKKATCEMKPEATFITNSFETGTPPTYVVPVRDERGGSLFIHKIPKTKRRRGVA